ncbi:MULTISPECIES: ferredoxin [Nocardia]|uniref:Ferredoxin n=1 Tax=Nocardia aurea TaxID=2144174 RepID=A0ABV3G2M2_9NOCA|nr:MULTISPECIES: ferredoxin [Nocardia]
MKVSIDDERCRGHGICMVLCDEVFAINDDGYAEVLVDEIPAEHEDKVREAVQNCPERAIVEE